MNKNFSIRCLFLVSIFALAACVTETKPEKFEAYSPRIDRLSGGNITVKCHAKEPKSKRTTACDLASVRLIDEATKDESEVPCKKSTCQVFVGTSVYSIEVKNKAGEVSRKMSGLTSGTVVNAFF